MTELTFLMAWGFLPNLLLSLLLWSYPKTRAYTYRGSRALSLALTVLPLIIAVAAVQENTAESPDEGFATFLGALLLAPVVAASWLASGVAAWIFHVHIVSIRRQCAGPETDTGL